MDLFGYFLLYFGLRPSFRKGRHAPRFRKVRKTSEKEKWRNPFSLASNVKARGREVAGKIQNISEIANFINQFRKTKHSYWFKLSCLSCVIFICFRCFLVKMVKLCKGICSAWISHTSAEIFFLINWRHKRLKNTIDLLLFYGEHFYGFSESEIIKHVFMSSIEEFLRVCLRLYTSF